MTLKILAQDDVYRGWTTIRKLTLSDGTGTFTREIEDHGAAVAVLPYDPMRRTALLVRMPRAPVFVAGMPDLLEAPAGLIDEGEDAQTAARREAAEEAGVVLRELEHVATLWSCPGLSTERITLYLAAYDLADRVTAGGGLAHEHENITVEEWSLRDLDRMLEGSVSADMKTFTLLKTLRLRDPTLFDS